MTTIRLFAYGSLKRAEANHVGWLDTATYLGEARTAPRYTLIDLGPYPAMLAGGHTAVEGELYDFDVVGLAALDEFEDHPEIYLRTDVALDDGSTAVGYVYVAADAARYPVVASGRWTGAASG